MTQKLWWAAAAVLIVSATGAAAARTSTSATLAADVVRLMEQRSMDSIAAVDPQSPGRFVAALHIAGGQLLVVSGLHPSLEALRQRIASAEYREVYLDLQGTPSPKGKFFVMDTNADGLFDAPNNGEVDVVFRNGDSTIRFDGKAKEQKLTDTTYASNFADADKQYAYDLGILKAALEAPSSPGGAPAAGTVASGISQSR